MKDVLNFASGSPFLTFFIASCIVSVVRAIMGRPNPDE